MISKRNMLIAGAISAACVPAVVGAASATPSEGLAQETKQRGTIRSAHDLSVFRDRHRLTRRQRGQRARLARAFRGAPLRLAVARAEFPNAVPVPIDGGSDSVWVAPTAAGGVCTFIPDPIDGYGSSCATVEEINAGLAVTMLGGGTSGTLASSAITAVIVPDGRAGPTLSGPGIATRTLRVASNVATAVARSGDTVTSEGKAIVVPPPAGTNCALAAPGDTFRRCSS